MSNSSWKTRIVFILAQILYYYETSSKVILLPEMTISMNKNPIAKLDPILLDCKHFGEKSTFLHLQNQLKSMTLDSNQESNIHSFCSKINSTKYFNELKNCIPMTGILTKDHENQQKNKRITPLRTPTRFIDTIVPDKSFHYSFQEKPTKLLSRKLLNYPTDDFYQEYLFSKNRNSEADLLGRVVPHPHLTKHNWNNRVTLVQSAPLDKVHNSWKIDFPEEDLRPTKTPSMLGRPNHETNPLSQIFSPNGPLSEDPIIGNSSNNCTTNCSEDILHAPTFQRSTLIKGVVLSTIAFLSFLGNMVTLGSILRTGRQGTSTVYMLLLQLALADLLVTVFCILAEGVWTLTVDWRGGNILCKVVKFMQMFSLYLSTFVLVLIGFDRLGAVRFPMHRAHAKHHVRRGIVFIWILSGVFSAPQVVIFRVLKGPFVEEFHQCVTYGFYSALWQEQLYTTITLILMFLLPLLILVATYVTTFITITSRQNILSERLSRSAYDDARHNILHKAKVKSLMITVVIVLTFVVCWTPYYGMMVIFMFLDPDEQLGQDLQSAIFFFGSSTALFNPLIYGLFHLRSKPKRMRSKSTSFYSSSSKVENCNYRRSCSRRSHGEIVNMHNNGRRHRFVANNRNGMRNGMLVSSV